MNTTHIKHLLLLGLTTLSLPATINLAPGVSGGNFHTHSTNHDIVSFDWAAGDLYTMTALWSMDMNVWRHTSSGPTNIYSNPNNFVGASLVTIGDFVYFNHSDFSNTQFIYSYGPISGSPTATQVSTTPNWGLYGHNGELFITGAVGFGTNQIFHSPLNADGTLVNDPAINLGVTSGSSGPIAFDNAGNLFYAPGFGDQSIYRWTAAEVAAAIADPSGAPLSMIDALWHDYSATHSSPSGATGMVIGPDGNLVVSLSDFMNPSILVEFQIDSTDAFAGYFDILTATGRLGDVRYYNGSLFVASGNEIFEITAVPEPAAFAFLAGLFGLLLSVLNHRRRNSRKA